MALGDARIDALHEAAKLYQSVGGVEVLDRASVMAPHIATRRSCRHRAHGFLLRLFHET